MSKPEEQASAELRALLIEMEIGETRRAFAFHQLKERMIPEEWHGIERSVPVPMTRTW